jgi:hypothetical protein
VEREVEHPNFALDSKGELDLKCIPPKIFDLVGPQGKLVMILVCIGLSNLNHGVFEIQKNPECFYNLPI